MNLSVQVALNGSLQFRTPAHELATLSPNAITALANLAKVPPEVNPIVHRHVQTIVQHLPAERAVLVRLGLATETDDVLDLIDAGRRFAAWLMHEWKPWTRYIRTLPPDAVSVWRWNVTFRAGQVDSL